MDTPVKTNISPACEDCGGRCCSYRKFGLHFVPLTDEEAQQPILKSKLIQVEIDGQKRPAIPLEPQCRFLDPKGRCTVYDVRPRACRNYVCHKDPRMISKIILQQPDLAEILKKWELLPGQQHGLQEPDHLATPI